MARQERRKEDLIADATALVDRVELHRVHDAEAAERIVAGFRENGGLSLFFGEDPVYQFNAAGELRRAYCDGALYKASQGKLVRLVRHRPGGEVQLRSTELTTTEQAHFLDDLSNHLQVLQTSVIADRLQVSRQVSGTGTDVAQRLVSWLKNNAETILVAAHPRV